MKEDLADHNAIADEIQELVDRYARNWRDISDEALTQRPAPDSWSIKEIIGHLIDSAANNHQRIVRLQISDNLVFPRYSLDNDAWVRIQDYQGKSWEQLLGLWQYYGYHLAWLIRRIDLGCLNHVWQRDKDTRLTLHELMTGYLRHLKEHIQQIEEQL